MSIIQLEIIYLILGIILIISSLMVLKIGRRKRRFELSEQLVKIGVIMILMALLIILVEISYKTI